MRIADFLIADDIRFEMGSKISIIGVFDESIEINNALVLPYPLRVGFFVRVLLEESHVPDEFELELKFDGKVLGEIKGTIGRVKEGIGNNLTIPIPSNLIPISGSGELTTTFRLLNRGNEVHCEERVMQVNMHIQEPSSAKTADGKH